MNSAAPTTYPPPPLRRLITFAVMLATVLQVIDTTIANVALPHMQGSFSATQDQMAWVLTSYIVAAAIMTPPIGYLADRFGRRRVFMVAVAGFTFTSMLCGVATSIEQMVGFRLMQGVFGAALVPLSQSTMLDTFPPEMRGKAMAMWAMGVMIGPILGPSLGGYLTEYYSWRWIFYINVPFGVLAFLGIAAFMPETDLDRERPFDWTGFAFLSLAIGALQMMLDRGESQDWFNSPEIIVEAALAGLSFYMFLVHTLTAARPFIDPAMFKDRNLTVGLCFIFVVGTVLLATLALMPPFMQTLLGYPVLLTGLVLAPSGVATLIAAQLASRLSSRIDSRILLGAGFLITAYSQWETAQFTTSVSVWLVTYVSILRGFGLGFLFMPLTAIAFATLAPQYRNYATALFSLMRNIGSSIGVSIVVFMLARSTQVNHATLVNWITPFNPVLQMPNVASVIDLSSPRSLAILNGAITRQAALIGYLNDFRVLTWLSLLVIPLLLLLRKPPRLGGRPGGAPAPAAGGRGSGGAPAAAAAD
jgi:DHA2 family multidrug resistance protein